jgi:hypothetical protein
MLTLLFGPTDTPYQYTFDPPPFNSGDAVVIPGAALTPPLNPSRGRGFNISSNRTSSLVSIITSFGMDAGSPPNGTSILSVDASFTFDSFFFTTGNFNSVGLSTSLKLFVEEFQSGAFVGSIAGPSNTLVNRTIWYFAGGDRWPPFSGSQTVSLRTTSISRHPISPLSFYRVWIDVEGFIFASGEQFLGFSGAINNFITSIDQVTVTFT